VVYFFLLKLEWLPKLWALGVVYFFVKSLLFDILVYFFDYSNII